MPNFFVFPNWRYGFYCPLRWGKTNNLSKTKTKDQNKRHEDVAEKSSAIVQPDQQELDHTFTSDRVPSTFVKLVKCFFPEAKTIEEYWKMTRIAAYRNNREKETDTVLDYAINAFKQMIRKAKAGRVRNYFAYYYGILCNKLYNLYLNELYEMGFGASRTVTDLEFYWKSGGVGHVPEETTRSQNLVHDYKSKIDSKQSW